jgi:hypothetical protein
MAIRLTFPGLTSRLVGMSGLASFAVIIIV